MVPRLVTPGPATGLVTPTGRVRGGQVVAHPPVQTETPGVSGVYRYRVVPCPLDSTAPTVPFDATVTVGVPPEPPEAAEAAVEAGVVEVPEVQPAAAASAPSAAMAMSL